MFNIFLLSSYDMCSQGRCFYVYRKLNQTGLYVRFYLM